MRGCDLATVVNTSWYELLSVVSTVDGLADNTVDWLPSKLPLVVVIVNGVPCLNKSLAIDVAGFADDTIILLIFGAVGCRSIFDGTAGIVIGTNVIGRFSVDFCIIFAVVPARIWLEIEILSVVISVSRSTNIEYENGVERNITSD